MMLNSDPMDRFVYPLHVLKLVGFFLLHTFGCQHLIESIVTLKTLFIYTCHFETCVHFLQKNCKNIHAPLIIEGEGSGLVVNASDSGSRGRGFQPHSGQTVLCP